MKYFTSNTIAELAYNVSDFSKSHIFHDEWTIHLTLYFSYFSREAKVSYIWHKIVAKETIIFVISIKTLFQVMSEKPRSGARGRLSVVKAGGGDREAIRQCFLFSNHMLITTRTHAGRSVSGSTINNACNLAVTAAQEVQVSVCLSMSISLSQSLF